MSPGPEREPGEEPGTLHTFEGVPGAMVLGGFAGGAAFILGSELGYWPFAWWPLAAFVAIVFLGAARLERKGKAPE